MAMMSADAFCAAVEQHQVTLLRTAKAILKNDEDAEDAVQEALYAAFAHRDGLKDPEKFKPWILRILSNKCYDRYRQRRKVVELSEYAETLPAPETDLAEKLTLWQAVMSLGDDLRATVTLFYYEGLSIRDISRALGVSEAAVKTRLSRGRQRLRQILEGK